MAKNKENVSTADIDDVTRALVGEGVAQSITKDKNISTVKTGIEKQSPLNVKSFLGKRLKHNKSVWIHQMGTILVAAKGELFDDIPLEKKQLVAWFDSDFEN